jgi:hypothetical protein
MILSRIMAVLAAILLVGAFALATVLPPGTSLVELLADMDHPLLVWLKDVSTSSLPSWVWDGVEVPILVRPAWLVPTSLGLIALGCAITLGSRKRVVGSHRRRS